LRRIGAGALVVATTCVLGAAAGPAEPAADAVRRSPAAAHQSTAARATPLATTAWCGEAAQTDRAPNVVAGNPVHWVYLVPADGADSFGSVAPVMQSDAEQVDAWWRGQDSTRVPRNDLATFPCGTQLDITVVRSTLPGSQLAPLGGRFPAILETLRQAGMTSEHTKYLVYYDGPADEGNVCGQGGSNNPGGFGLAVVFYRACVGISTAAVAAHEFLHTTGAVEDAAPHACTEETSGHTCDLDADLMHPFIGGGPLSGKSLDPGRDDYYGHPGAWDDSQDSAWLVRLAEQVPLTLSVVGPGSVTANVPGLQCATSCTTTWNAGQRLTLSATPAAGAKLVRWTGPCSGSGSCALTVTPGTAPSALFAPVAFRLTVAVKGRGTVSGAGIQCRPRCAASLPSFRATRLSAAPAKGWRFRAWTGACKGAKRTCTVPMSAATTVRATFVRR
jgi:hypothetical protein